MLCVLMLCVAAAQAASPSAGSLPDEAVTAQIDQRLRASWLSASVTPSRRAPDGVWARRVYLDLVGRVPTVEELEAFRSDPAKDRRARLVDRLLGEEYLEQRARWQAIEWANLLVGQSGGVSRDSLVHRPGFLAYLRGVFRRQKPVDQLMRELVTATGSVRPDDDDHNGAANFLADKMAEGGVQATARTAQVFLGVSVQCTQCHNHQFNERKQDQFWELNAFFRQTRVERIREEDGDRPFARVFDRDFYGEGRTARTSRRAGPEGAERAEIYYELRNGKLKVAYPVFLDGTPLAEVFEDRGLDYGDSGRLDRVNRRQELAELIAASPDLALATVNREWARYFGYGLTRPPHDMGPHNPPSHPELLEELAAAFRDSGYDLDRLARWIVRSEAYGLDSRAGRSNEGDDPTLGVAPLFSRFYLRQLSAEQIYESLLTATRADRGLGEEDRDRARRRWLRQFVTAFGNDENGEATSFNGSIPQALAMMNGELTRRATSLEWESRESDYGSPNNGFLASVAADEALSNADRIERLYLAAVARKPDRAELKISNELLAAREGDAAEALRDVWWALLNSNEFILQH